MRWAVVGVVIETTALYAGTACLGGGGLSWHSRRRCRGRGSLRKALQPEIIMLEVPADSGISCCASAEPLVVAKPHASGEARARGADNALVGQQRRSPCRKGGDEDLSVQVPSLHPSYEVADCAPGSRFLLGDHHPRPPQQMRPASERGSMVRAVTCGVDRFRQQLIKVNILTSHYALLDLVRYWRLLASGGCRGRRSGGGASPGGRSAAVASLAVS